MAVQKKTEIVQVHSADGGGGKNSIAPVFSYNLCLTTGSSSFGSHDNNGFARFGHYGLRQLFVHKRGHSEHCIGLSSVKKDVRLLL